MSAEPNVNFGFPAIFFDSHPDEQESYLYSYWSSLKTSLKIAYTGRVPKPLLPGTLRITWYTIDGNEGQKDYELHEYAIVRKNFDVLLALEEVRRVVITGFSGQNPYIMTQGRNPWQDKFTRQLRNMEREAKEARRGQEKTEHSEGFRKDGEAKSGMLVDIEGVIEEHDRVEEEKMREAREKHWKESDGLLTGEMV
jgi:hypothetical protein